MTHDGQETHACGSKGLHHDLEDTDDGVTTHKRPPVTNVGKKPTKRVSPSQSDDY